MNENFNFYKLSSTHKKRYIITRLSVFTAIIISGWIGISVTNPTIVETSDKMSVTFSVILGFIVIVLAFFNRLKSLLKIKFVAFLIIWILLFGLQSIMNTLIWTIGLVVIPLMIDDLILLPIWNRLWYNNYD